MNVRGLHGVPKELLIKPTVKESQDGRASARRLGAMDKDANVRGQLLNAYDDPSGALSNVVRYSREQAFVKVRRATDRHYRKLLSAGRLFEAKFAPGAQLGFRLHIAAYSKDKAVREVLEIEETYEDCPFWPDKLQPTDELVAVNGKLVVEASRESFPGIVAEVTSAARPMVLTFASGLHRAKAFSEQQRRRAAGGGARPVEAVDAENDDEDRFAAEYDAAQQDRARNLEEARRQGIRDGEREVACLLDQEACPCFHFHLGLAAKKCPDCCEPVDAQKVLAEAEIPGFKRVPGRKADCAYSKGQLVKVRAGCANPRLGWYGGYVRSPASVGVLPIDHASIGVVVDVDLTAYEFAVVSVCFDWVVRGFKVDAADLEAAHRGDEKAYDGHYDLQAASLDAFEKERRRRTSSFGHVDRAYIFVNEDLEDHIRRPSRAGQGSIAAMELERYDEDARGGSIIVAHEAAMKRKHRKSIDIRERQTDYPCKPLYEDAPTESVTPEASEQDPLDIVDAGALIDYVFGEIDDTIKFAKDELYADEDDEEDVKAPHMTETLFPEDGLEKHAPHITEELSYVCADPEYDARFAVTGWDGDITEAMSFRVPFVEVDVALPDLPDRIEIPHFRLPDVPSFMLHMPKFGVPDIDIPDLPMPHIPGVDIHDFDMLPEVEKPKFKIPKGPAIPHDRDFWDPTMVENRMRRAKEASEEFAAPPVATMHDEEDYEHSFHRHGADVAGLGDMHGYADEPRTVPDGFAEAKDDFAPDIDDFQFQSAFAKSRQHKYADSAADRVAELPGRKPPPVSLSSESSFRRADLKHREFSQAKKRATMMAFPEMEYHPEAKGTYGDVVAGGPH
ncbi:hypothetical protein JL720_2890 [Aureococcus anophagefferens]|nr:hypothetical protein JL720_2890 [Aureococcus anophagefferens]